MSVALSPTTSATGLKPGQRHDDGDMYGTVTRSDEGDHSLRYTDDVDGRRDSADFSQHQPCKVYKRRFFGLFQLTLLNLIVSWDWLTYAPVSPTAALYFDTSISTINWLSTAFLFAFCVAAPFTIPAFRRGPKTSIVVASALILVGNWIRYAGARASKPSTGYGVTMLGQIIIGFAQPFVLSAPTRYSDMWFTERGRIAATAFATLANPLGGALGQLIDGFLATEPGQIPDMVLYVAIISSVATIPSVFIPARPPTPPTTTSITTTPTFSWNDLKSLFRNPSFLLIFIPFSILVSAFNALSSLLNDILFPYGYSQTAASVSGALLIFVGLVASAVSSPILDRFPQASYNIVKVLVLLSAAMYLGFVFAPGLRTDAAPYAMCAILGAASFSPLPVVLELLVDVTWPLSPEITSVLAWSSGQLGGAITIIVMDALRDTWPGDSQPQGNLKAGLVYLAVLVWIAVPFPLPMGYWGFGERKRPGVHSRPRGPEEFS